MPTGSLSDWDLTTSLRPIRSLVLTIVQAKIAGENCYGQAKMRMIAQWIADRGLKGALGRVRFYSDHVSDRPVFEWADEPVAVNPDSRLKRLAHERGWRIDDWKT